MIVITIPGDSEKSMLKKYKKTLCLNENENGLNMIVVENNMIYGCSEFIIKENTAVISLIYISQEHRGMKFGDGLLRATLNCIEKMGVDKAYIPANDSWSSFLEHEGIPKDLFVPEWYSDFGEEMQWYGCHISDFFNKPCKGNA